MSSSNNGQVTTNAYPSLLQVQQSYPTAVYIICPILITYFGVYVMLRNHYIFRPRIDVYLKKAHLKSIILKGLIIDLISSLSTFTFFLSSIVLSSNDKAIQLMIHQDLYWSGLFMSVLAYRNIREDELLQMKVVVKNGIFLISCYILITYQYFSNYSFLMMGLVLIAVYITNVIFKAYEDNFVELIQMLFNNKPLEINKIPYNHVNKMESPEYLASNFPVSREELEVKLEQYEPYLRRLKLKTKISVTKKLLMLSLAVRISKQKMTAKMKRDVAAYYGGLNGTTNQKVKRLDYECKNSLTPEQGALRQGTIEVNEEDVILNILQVDDELEVLFTIFPIRLFESSIIISMIFTLILNLAFGICLDYTISITSTVKYGQYFNNLYALLILPVLPNISKTQYFNSMTLSSLWKYFLIGLFVTISVAVNGGINTSEILQIQVILVMVMIIFVMGFLLSESNNQYKLFIVFFLIFAANLGITYSGAQETNGS